VVEDEEDQEGRREAGREGKLNLIYYKMSNLRTETQLESYMRTEGNQGEYILREPDEEVAAAAKS